MKDLIRKILREYEEEKILVVPSLEYFGNDWNSLQSFLQSKGNPKWRTGGDLNLYRTPIESLGNLISVGGNLNLYGTSIKSLGNLTSVGGYLTLHYTPIESLGNLTTVGGYLNLGNTPISRKYTEKKIRQMVNVEGEIFM